MHRHVANIVEWESTIHIPSDERTYKSAAHSAKGSDVIFLFENGTRLSARTMQRKITKTCRNVMGFYRNELFPIKRTTASEKLETINLKIEKAIHRLITYNKDGIRISHNKEEGPDGVRYNIEYEVEYEENTPYIKILEHERRLMNAVLDGKHTIVRDIMSLENIFSCVMCKVQMWHCFDPNLPYIWAYKWNGVKAKMLIVDKILPEENGSYLTYLWPDANAVSTQQCRGGSNLSLLLNLCLLVEIMDDCIVIIETIGFLVSDIIYTTEPMTNASILKYLRDSLRDVSVGGKKVLIQEFYESKLPNTYDDSKFDGFIIIQNDMVIKWKAPTLDVKCVAPFTYSVANNLLKLDLMGEVGKIYEISCANTVLRQRNDRLVSSSANEYDVFLESVKQLRGGGK